MFCSNRSSNNTHDTIHELQQQNALLQKALSRLMKMIDLQHAGNCKEQDDELRLHIKELQNNISNKLIQTESKLKQLLSLSELVYISYNSNHGNESLWPLILFMSNEISNQVAPAVILKMSNFAKMKKDKEIWHSKSFFAFQEGYEMRLGVSAAGSNDGEGTHVSVYLHLMKGPHDDKLEQSGHWPLRGIFTIELLNQLSDNNHHSRLVQFQHYFCSECTNRVLEGFMAKKGPGISQFISHDILLHHNNSGYHTNDSLMFRITYSYDDVEPPYQVAPVTFKVTRFRSQWLNNKGKWGSSPFFAFDGGYQMLLNIYAAGSEGTHVSVYLQLMKGSHDDKLEQSGHWPLSGVFQIELLSQLNDSDHYSFNVVFGPRISTNVTTIEEDGMYARSSYGISQFISHDFLLHHSKNKYLKEDTAYFRISYRSCQAFDWNSMKLSALLIVLAVISLVISLYLSTYFRIRMRHQAYHQELNWNKILKLTSLLIVIVVVSSVISLYWSAYSNINIGYQSDHTEFRTKLHLTASLIAAMVMVLSHNYTIASYFNWNEILKLTAFLIVMMVTLLSTYLVSNYPSHRPFDWNAILKLTVLTFLIVIVVILLIIPCLLRISYLHQILMLMIYLTIVVILLSTYSGFMASYQSNFCRTDEITLAVLPFVIGFILLSTYFKINDDSDWKEFLKFFALLFVLIAIYLIFVIYKCDRNLQLIRSLQAFVL